MQCKVSFFYSEQNEHGFELISYPAIRILGDTKEKILDLFFRDRPSPSASALVSTRWDHNELGTDADCVGGVNGAGGDLKISIFAKDIRRVVLFLLFYS